MYAELYDLVVKILLAGALGALIGIEREYSKKQHLFGARTFLLVSLWGMLSVELSKFDSSLTYFPLLSFMGVLVLTFFFFKISSDTRKGGLTTFVLFPLAFMIGIMVAYSFFVPAVAIAVIVTAVLYAKKYSSVLVKKLTEAEWSDIIRFALILFVLYPISPAILTLYGFNFNLDIFFKMIYFVSAISLAAFLLQRIYPKLSLSSVGFLGGLVNSVSTVYLVLSKVGRIDKSLFRVYSASQIASALRNIFFIALFSMALFLQVWPFFLAVIAVHFIIQLFSPIPSINIGMLKFDQPFTMSRAIKLAVIFLFISAMIDFVIRTSEFGLYIVSFVGGLFSSIATIASILAGSQNLTQPQVILATLSAFLGGVVASAGIGFLFEQKAMRLEVALSLLASIIIMGMLAFFLVH